MNAWVLETWAQLRRWLLRLTREQFSLALGLVQPVIFLVFLGSAFDRIARSATGTSYRAFLLPGIIALTVFGNSLAGGIPLLFDRESGLFSRLLATPVSRSSILISRFLAVNVMTGLECLLMLALALLMGITIATGVTGVLGILLFGVFLGMGITIVSLILSFTLRGHGDFFAVIGIVTLPLTFLSTAFVPESALPAWMAVAARLNPLTHAVEAIRSLVLTGWNWGLLGRTLSFLVLFDLLMMALGVWVLRKKVQI
jgi:ABC-2 type transport system permease protein